MDWQQLLSFFIVTLSVFLLVRGNMRKNNRAAGSSGNASPTSAGCTSCDSCNGCSTGVTTKDE
jgi:hypothetical protein